MRLAPSHSTATLDRLMSTLTVGNIIAIRRPPRSDVAVSSSLACLEAGGLLRLADERPHDAQAGDLLAQHAVDGVDALLHAS